MTAATAHLTRPALRTSLRGRSAHVLGAVAFALPVPLFAALGLSLPLPATVERIAAELVPFASFRDSGAELGVGGTIVAAPGDDPAAPPATLSTALASGPVDSGRAALASSPSRPQSASAPAETGSRPGSPADSAEEQQAATSAGSTPTNTVSPSSQPDTGPADTSTTATTSTTVVDTASNTVTTVVDTATTAAAPATETINGVTETVTGTVKGTTGELLPP
jgi:hypothetical protein